MARPVVTIDPEWFGLRVFDWHLDVRSRSAGAGLTGRAQTVYGSNPRWRASLDFSRMTPARARVWRARLFAVRGTVGLMRIRVSDPYRLTMAEAGASPEILEALAGPGVAHSDDTLFTDDTGYSESPVTLSVAAGAAGDVTLGIDGDALGNADLIGRFFSIDDWLYAVTAQEGTGSDMVLTFEPPLRAAVPAGADVNFDAWAIMELDEDLAGRLPLEAGDFGRPSLSLTEWVFRE